MKTEIVLRPNRKNLADWEEVEAERGEEFQDYVNSEGESIKGGTPIGVENIKTGEFILYKGVFYN